MSYSENKLKCRLIDTLLLQYTASIIGVEVPFLAGQRWVDVLVITSKGDLVAYEIKSELDSLRRLEGQVGDYCRTFDRVHVVAAPTHLEQLRHCLPPSVGLSRFDEQDDAFTCDRRPKPSQQVRKRNLAQFLWKDDLIIGPKNTTETAVALRERLIRQATLRDIKRKAVQCLRRRYAPRFELFRREKSLYTHIEDLDYLTKIHGCLP